MRNTINLSLLILLLISCEIKNREQIFFEKLSGQWAIEEISFSDIDYTDYLDNNFLLLREDGTISIPQTAHSKKDNYAEWKLDLPKNDSAYLRIRSNNKVFNRIFRVSFIKNENKRLVGVVGQSDSTYFKAYKFFQNYKNLEYTWDK